MDQILVEGHYYFVDVAIDSCDHSEHIEVFDIHSDKVGSAVVNHDTECVNVYYNLTEMSASYPYFDLVHADGTLAGLLKLAEWIVATDPING